MCERCRSKGVLNPAVIVHHKIHVEPETINNPGVTLNWDNLEALCRQCHGLEHGGEEYKTIKARYEISRDGRVIL